MKRLSHALRRAFHFLGTAWCLFGLVLLFLLLLEGALYTAFQVRAWILLPGKENREGDPRARADAYHGAPWAQELFREFEASNRTEWRSYVYWRRKPYQGRYINVDEHGLRRTWNPSPSGKQGAARPFRVFVFGGSTTWGTGARDDYTLPSCLSRELAAGDRPVEVTNFGEMGYVNTQEMIAFFLELREGNVPDLAVFYDGVNDVFSAFQNMEAGVPQNEENRRREFNSLLATVKTEEFLLKWFHKTSIYKFSEGLGRRLSGRPRASPEGWRASLDTRRGEELAREVVHTYAGNLCVIRALAGGHGVRTLFYWQPVLFLKEPRTPYEEKQVEKARWLRDFYLQVCREAASSRALSKIPGFHDISRLFRKTGDPLFIDWSHLGEEGNARVARRIARDVIPLFGDSR